MSGVVRALGPDVTKFRVGDAVSAIPGYSQRKYGSYAEVALVPADALVSQPDGLSFEQAASIWMQYLTAYGALIDIAQLGAGEAVVIPAASSSVGLAAIQIARLAGATPIATTRTRAKRAALLDAGAATVVATEQDDVTAAIMAASGGKGARVVFDPVGGRTVLELADGMAPSGIARHERCHSRRQHVLDLEHHLDVLSCKPGALAGSKPLAPWRAAGRWPVCYDELWDRLQARHSKQNGTRAMVAVVALGREFGHDQLRAAITTAVSLGACDVAAVRYLLTEARLRKGERCATDVGELALSDRPMSTRGPFARRPAVVSQGKRCRGSLYHFGSLHRARRSLRSQAHYGRWQVGKVRVATAKDRTTCRGTWKAMSSSERWETRCLDLALNQARGGFGRRREGSAMRHDGDRLGGAGGRFGDVNGPCRGTDTDRVAPTGARPPALRHCPRGRQTHRPAVV